MTRSVIIRVLDEILFHFRRERTLIAFFPAKTRWTVDHALQIHFYKNSINASVLIFVLMTENLFSDEKINYRKSRIIRASWKWF